MTRDEMKEKFWEKWRHYLHGDEESERQFKEIMMQDLSTLMNGVARETISDKVTNCSKVIHEWADLDASLVAGKRTTHFYLNLEYCIHCGVIRVKKENNLNIQRDWQEYPHTMKKSFSNLELSTDDLWGDSNDSI